MQSLQRGSRASWHSSVVSCDGILCECQTRVALTCRQETLWVRIDHFRTPRQPSGIKMNERVLPDRFACNQITTTKNSDDRRASDSGVVGAYAQADLTSIDGEVWRPGWRGQGSCRSWSWVAQLRLHRPHYLQRLTQTRPTYNRPPRRCSPLIMSSVYARKSRRYTSEERYENHGSDKRYANVLLVRFGNRTEKLCLPQSKHIVTLA